MKTLMNYQAKVEKCRREKRGSNVFLLKLSVNNGRIFRAQPGQFILLEASDRGHRLSRPFSIVDISNNIITLLIRVCGSNTKAYSKLRPGDFIGISEPMGTPIKIDNATKKYVLIGGGIGGAALAFLAKRLVAMGKDVTALLGAKESSQLSGIQFFRSRKIKLKTITEHSSRKSGLVTDLFRKTLQDTPSKPMVIACGPKQMLESISKICSDNDIGGLAILEDLMACGMGACMGCVIKGRDGTAKHICSDGPAFDMHWIDWADFMRDYYSIHTVEPTPKEVPIDFSCRIGNVELEYSTMNCSGTLSLEAIENGCVDFGMVGALVTKSITPAKSPGNKGPRICETPSGMINSIGIENVGIDAFIEMQLPRWLAFAIPVFASISADSINGFALMARKLSKTPIAGIKINVSCPNIERGGMLFGVDPEMIRSITKAVRKEAPNKAIIVKLTPNVTNIVEMAKAARDGGADAVALINTLSAMSIDVRTLRTKIGNDTGGLSGPAIRPIGVRMVNQVFKENLGIRIIGMAGIEDADSAAEYIIAGADTVGIGTGLFLDHNVLTKIHYGLEDIIRCHGFKSRKELTGSVIYRK